MTPLFPYSNIVLGVMLLVIGFVFHWVGQLISLINWDLAAKIGIAEPDLAPEFKAYERAIAVADVAIGWIYGVAAVGLFMNAEWGYKLAWIPGSILIYHAISAWQWEDDRRTLGHRMWSEGMRIGWCASNAGTGILALILAWIGKSG
nr:putative uncharacterized protein [uncultured bacterium]